MARRKRKSQKASPIGFFSRHAGYVVGRKREGARNLAKAESIAEREGWRVEWEEEQSPDLSWADDEDREGISEVLSAVLRDRNGRVLASLGNVTFGRNHVDAKNYGRVVEAGLALEAASNEGLM